VTLMFVICMRYLRQRIALAVDAYLGREDALEQWRPCLQ
jgi:hypothetical protein